MRLGDEILYQGVRAIISEVRDGGFFDLIVYGTNVDGDSPYIVRCIPAELLEG